MFVYISSLTEVTDKLFSITTHSQDDWCDMNCLWCHHWHNYVLFCQLQLLWCKWHRSAIQCDDSKCFCSCWV